MTRLSEKREMDAILARMTAEDKAVNYLGTLSAEIAAAVAFRVAWFLATTWEYKQCEMLQRGTAGNTIPVNRTDLQKLNAILAMVPPGTVSNATAEQRVTAMLADFPPDQAWWVANTVAGWAASRLRMADPVPL
jgi:hypothetical protein